MWIEIYNGSLWNFIKESRPARALWIEMTYLPMKNMKSIVEAREGLVD